MPLLKGKENISKNIHEMRGAGHPMRVSIAAALQAAYGRKKKKGKK